AKALLGGYSTPDLRALLARAHSLVSPAVLAARVQAVLSVDATAELKACAVPLLYLEGASDHVVPGRNLRAILRLRPEVQSVTTPAPHLVLQTRPVEASGAVASFLRSLPDPRGRTLQTQL